MIGPNGAGKSTLFNLITGVVKPTDGSVRFAGDDMTGLPPHSICQRGISRTFQLTSLFPEMTARENARSRRRRGMRGAGSLMAAAACSRRRASAGDAALEQLGLTHVASRPAGLLSHGDQRLLEVAMALAQQPQGAAAGRADAGPVGRGDGAGGGDAGRLLSDGAMTVLLVEHDMEVVFRLAHMITVLHRGAVIADGTPDGGQGRCARAGGVSRGPRLMLSIEGLNTHYGASHVLQGVDLELPEGRICRGARPQWRRQDDDVASTIMGLVPPSGGRVTLDGTRHHRLAAASGGARRRRLCAGGAADLSRPDGGREHPRRGAQAGARPGRSRG